MSTWSKASFAVACLGLAAADAFANGLLPEPLAPLAVAAIAALTSVAAGAVLAAFLIRRHVRASS